jgi:hypothetical protein
VSERWVKTLDSLFAAIFILRSTRALTLIGFAGKVAAALSQSAANHHQSVINLYRACRQYH